MDHSAKLNFFRPPDESILSLGKVVHHPPEAAGSGTRQSLPADLNLFPNPIEIGHGRLTFGRPTVFRKSLARLRGVDQRTDRDACLATGKTNDLLEELSPADWTGGQLTLTLTEVAFSGSGTGRFLLWTEGALDPIVHFDSENIPDSSLTLPVGSHTHYNWGFSEIGTYEISIEISGTHVDDGAQLGNATYTFQVVPEPSTALLGALGALALLRRRR